MNQRDDVGLLITAWFEATAPAREPEHLFDETIAQVARTRRRPAWRIPERWIPMQNTMRFHWMPRLAPILVVLALLLIVAGLAAVLSGSQRRLPSPIGPAENGRIGYISGNQVWTARPDGSDARAMTSDPMVKRVPIFSRDGTRLAFLAGPGPAIDTWSLIVADEDGRQVTIERDAEKLLHYSWSPDGSKIAYSKWITYPGQRDRVFVAASDGSTPPVQIGDPDLSAWDPAFSPDGSRIVFQSDRNDRFALGIMNADGSDVRELTDVQIQPSTDMENSTRGFEFSPDGRKVLFTGKDASAALSLDLYVAAVDGPISVHHVTDDARLDFGASWSPLGDRIVYLRGERSDSREAVVANADGSGARVLASPVDQFSPLWSPDGRSIAVLDALDQGDGAMRIIPVDGGAPVTFGTGRLVDGPGAGSIAWQRLGN